MAWAYVEGGAEDELTLQRNADGTVAGVPLSLPVALAPTGLTGFSHWRGELGAAQAAERCGTRSIVSNAATYSLQEIADGTSERHWFQLYPWGNNRGHKAWGSRRC